MLTTLPLAKFVFATAAVFWKPPLDAQAVKLPYGWPGSTSAPCVLVGTCVAG